jgi:hypothetical protein
VAFRSRLLLQCGSSSAVDLVWQNLKIRAEEILYRLPDAATEQKLIAELDEQRQSMPGTRVDFSDAQSTVQNTVIRTAQNCVFLAEKDGLRVDCSGTNEQTGVGQLFTNPWDGCADVEAVLKVHEHGTPTRKGRTSEVSMMLHMSDSYVNYAAVILRKTDNERREVVAQTSEKSHNGKNVYRPIRGLPVKTLQRARIVVRDNSLYFLYAEDAAGPLRLLAEVPLREPVNPSQVSLRAQAPGDGCEVSVTWKELTAFLRPTGAVDVPDTGSGF